MPPITPIEILSVVEEGRIFEATDFATDLDSIKDAINALVAKSNLTPTGLVGTGTTHATGGAVKAITFPTEFASAPVVLAMLDNYSSAALISGVTTTGFNVSAAGVSSATFRYIALLAPA